MPLVSILMPTYNHEKYIALAIESALSQDTEYSYELLINDDVSTDGTLKIAREYAEKYPEKIKLFTHEKNQGLLKSYKYLLEQASGKYIAILESDDIWSNPEKLQKQISFMEKNDDYGLICGDYYTINEAGERTSEVIKDFDYGKDDFWYDTLMNFSSIGALTIVFRREVFDRYCNIDDYIERKFQTFDRPVWLAISKHSKCKYMHEALASYRVMGSSISNSGSFEKGICFAKSLMDIHEYIIEKYGLGSVTRELFDERKTIWFINLCVNYRRFDVFKEYASKLKGLTFKNKIMHFLPGLWWFQYTLRHPMPKHLK